MKTEWTESELAKEWQYRYEERLAILCGKDEPTESQIVLAKQDADATINALLSELPFGFQSKSCT